MVRFAAAPRVLPIVELVQMELVPKLEVLLELSVVAFAGDAAM
jgi:hypothetical protein